MCGEHRVEDAGVGHVDGSSPRVRGTLERLEAFARAVGIIPACAGNTAHMICLELPTRDHPRVCGEHDHIGHGGIRVKGSSPRVRGTPGRRVCAQAMRGIIPACAGNTLRPSHASSMHGDHPRVCGEHSGEGGEPEPKSGSSPRVRGTLRDGLGSCLHAGIIPACAGNTAYVLSAFSSSRDHPRVCGEHELPELRQAAIRGSSPRVRGTPPAQPIRLLLAGIIPACAGNTLWRVVCYVRGRDHPRVCGEHSLMPSPSSSASGSSPRVRGTPDGRRKSVEDMGIIPACAGNTVRWMSW